MNLWILIFILILIHICLIFILFLKIKNEPVQKIAYLNSLYLEKYPKINSNIKPHINIKYKSYKKVKDLLFNDIYKIPESNNKEYNIEHIVPQSMYGKNNIIKKDMHNLFLYPKNMNSQRSNYKYVDDPKIYDDSIILNGYGNKIKYDRPYNNNNSIKNNKFRIFHPDQKYKGEIARACMYFIRVYHWEETIFKYVIDPYTILLWHHQYPVSEFEKKKNECILKHQGNENKYVSNPEKLVHDMEELLGVKLDSFKNYQY